LLIRWLPIERVIDKRRHNYQRLARELGGIGGAKALFPELPADVVPYVFPLLIDRPAVVFERIRRAGMPVFRWESLSSDLDPVLHAVSLHYAGALFQVPCHQELTDEDLAWMIATLRAALLDA
jgi:dTDP-4-amino-4,6-dideoxygalactose transaminase